MSSIPEKPTDEMKHFEASTTQHVIPKVDTYPIEELENAEWLPEAALRGIEREHSLTFREALKLYPGAFWWAIAISFTIVMEGYNTYLLGNLFVYPSFARKYGSYFEDKGWVVTTGWQVALTDVTIAGQVTGLLLMGWLTDRFGHRLVIMGGMIAMVGLNFITVFAPNVQILCVAMALNGVPNGVFGILGSAYASEVAPLALRGFLTSFVNICWIIGQFVAGGVLNGLVNNETDWAFRIPFALQWMWIPPIFIIALFAPDSPWWCVRKGNLPRAEKALKRLGKGNTAAETRQSLAVLVQTNQMERATAKQVSMWDCFKGTNLRRTEIACMALSSQSLSGQVFAYGSTYFFMMAGLTASDAYKLNFGASGVAFVGTCGSWLLMIWFGRRPLMIYGLTSMTLCMLIIGCLSYVNNQSAVWTQAALTVIWLGLYSLTIGPQSFGLAAEVSATRLRSHTVSLARLVYQLCGLITSTIEPYLINPTAANLKGKTAFVWFGVSSLTILWCVLRLPETKGITYTEMDILFEKRTPAWKFKHSQENIDEAREQGIA